MHFLFNKNNRTSIIVHNSSAFYARNFSDSLQFDKVSSRPHVAGYLLKRKVFFSVFSKNTCPPNVRPHEKAETKDVL